MRFEGINHIGLIVTDLERSSRFMSETLGLTRHEKVARWFWAGRCMIHLVAIPDANPAPSPYYQFQHVALQVDDVREVFNRLWTASVGMFQLDMAGNSQPITSFDSDLSFGTGSIMFRDPDGNLFECLQIGRGLFADEPDQFA